MAFTHQNLNCLTSHSEPVWFLMESIIDERVGEVTENDDTCLQSRELSLKREGSSSSKQMTKRQRRVRFEPPAASIPRSLSSIIVNTDPSNQRTRQNFCDDLRRYFCPPFNKDTCVILKESKQCKHSVLPSSLTGSPEKRKAVSLGQLIYSGHSMPENYGIIAGIPIQKRIRLAKDLAKTVLRYHDTPWLRQSWSCEDIYFFEARKESGTRSLPNISAPHLNTKFTEHGTGELTRTTGFARNPLLFSLGGVLIELARGSSLEKLHEECDDQYGIDHRRFATARRLAAQADSDMGRTYDEIVKQLVECVFLNAEDLNDRELQFQLHEHVVTPLERLEQAFDRLHLGN